MIIKFKRYFLIFLFKKKLLLISHHRILHEINLDILKNTEVKLNKFTILVMGIHRTKKIFLKFFPGFKVGIQTEHLYDERGLKLNIYDTDPEPSILKNLESYDLILDLNANNKVFYKNSIASLKKIIYGPYIFPYSTKPYSGNSKDAYLFVGSISNKKRLDKILNFKKKYPKTMILGEGSYGSYLDSKIKTCSAIINFNSSNKKHTPYPRILKALIHGKPFISEPLPMPLIKDKHYLNCLKLNKKNLMYSYNLLSKFLVTNYSFDKFLDKLNKIND